MGPPIGEYARLPGLAYLGNTPAWVGVSGEYACLGWRIWGIRLPGLAYLGNTPAWAGVSGEFPWPGLAYLGNTPAWAGVSGHTPPTTAQEKHRKCIELSEISWLQLVEIL